MAGDGYAGAQMAPSTAVPTDVPQVRCAACGGWFETASPGAPAPAAVTCPLCGARLQLGELRKARRRVRRTAEPDVPEPSGRARRSAARRGVVATVVLLVLVVAVWQGVAALVPVVRAWWTSAAEGPR